MADSSVGTLIIGAGPAGLGCAYRLQELGDDDWLIVDSEDVVGGLARSFTDEVGFTWDIGGHVMFSQSPYYNQMAEAVLEGEGEIHTRECWIRMDGRWVPYPFQQNVGHLAPEMAVECIDALYRARLSGPSVSAPDFASWIQHVFGAGIATYFMDPYNAKVWAWPASEMSASWIAERVAVVEPREVLEKALIPGGDGGWGPNSAFKYPREGGTGGMWQRMARPLMHAIRLQTRVAQIDVPAKVVTLASGETIAYRELVSTMPLDRLVEVANAPSTPREAAAGLGRNRGVMTGIGIRRGHISERNWVYFPEEQVPFYRLTYLSNYSPLIVPEGRQDEYSALLLETSVSPHRPCDEATLPQRIIDALLDQGIIEPEDRERIVSVWTHAVDRSYPVPTLDRDQRLAIVFGWLHEVGIHSVGRFGAWRYEVGNMDHSFLMGVGAAERIHGVDHPYPESPPPAPEPPGFVAPGDAR